MIVFMTIKYSEEYIVLKSKNNIEWCMESLLEIELTIIAVVRTATVKVKD